MNRNRKRYVMSGVAAAAIATFAIGGYAWYQEPSKAPAGPTVEVRRGSLTETAAASGKIEPDVQVEVKSRASGQVIEVLVDEGDKVEAGQLLVRLDPTDAERDLAEARVARDRVKADLTAARASLSVAELDRKNVEVSQGVAEKSAELGLGSTDAARTAAHATKIAGANTTLRRAQLSSAEAQLKAAELAVQDAETRLKETQIYAPIAGTVLDVAVEKGTLVSSALTNVSGGSAVMTLADLSNLRIVGAIDEAQIGRVAVGQRVDIRVDAYGDRVFQGVVDRVSPLGKEVSSVVTFDVEIVIKDKDASLLRSGMSADVEIVTAEQKDVLLVPLLAVQSAGKRRFVRLASGEERPIQTGATDGAQMVVLDGLSEGDDVLASAPAPAAPAGQGQGQRPGGGQNPMRGMGMGMGRSGGGR
ncbi:hemolysin D [Sorangium cellulosum]|uniref:Hemolysin D n=1 Tax=Sorangium cellulosum TaxID=56 RepID=A0A2L0EZD4_SORCE|nr:efflux RND transporter periplasmic adaptor subunit [Sorangium cellulosum]AUX44599.1 hemolysin D [Sorangium cellulosum]